MTEPGTDAFLRAQLDRIDRRLADNQRLAEREPLVADRPLFIVLVGLSAGAALVAAGMILVKLLG